MSRTKLGSILLGMWLAFTPVIVLADTLLGTSTFSYTGSTQSYTAPTGTSYIVVKLWGGGGGSGFISSGGGGGGYVSAVVNTSGGTTFTVTVGQNGTGWNNGGDNGWSDGWGTPNIGTGGGAGSTKVTRTGVSIIAPGGGGAGDTNGYGSDASGAGGGRTFAGGSTGTGGTNGGASGYRFSGGGDGGQFLFTGAASSSSANGSSGASGRAPGGTGDAAYPGGNVGYGGNGSGADGYSGYAVIAAYQTSSIPTITGTGTQNRAQGQAAGYSITTTGSPAPTSYNATGLPTGYSVNTATGVITGNATTPGTYNSTLSATNSVGTGEGSVTWVVTAASITTNASASPALIVNGSSLTLTRDGSANFGIAWTENVIWPPSGGSPINLGNMALGSQSYTPAAGVGTYSYQFRVVDTYSNYQDQWISFGVSYPAPSAPLATVTQSYYVTLGWSAVSGASGYNVYRNGVKVNATLVTGTSYSDTTAQPGTAYSYTIRSVTSGGVESPDSTTVNTTTLAANLATDTDNDGVPDYLEQQLGANLFSGFTSDSSNTTQLSVHRPN